MQQYHESLNDIVLYLPKTVNTILPILPTNNPLKYLDIGIWISLNEKSL